MSQVLELTPRDVNALLGETCVCQHECCRLIKPVHFHFSPLFTFLFPFASLFGVCDRCVLRHTFSPPISARFVSSVEVIFVGSIVYSHRCRCPEFVYVSLCSDQLDVVKGC